MSHEPHRARPGGGVKDDLRPLWRRFRITRDPDIRDTLIRETIGLVRKVAGRLAFRLPPHVELDDLESADIAGLLAAIEAYDPDMEVDFAAYAQVRIRGAILDELRSLDTHPVRCARRRGGSTGRPRCWSSVSSVRRAITRSPSIWGWIWTRISGSCTNCAAGSSSPWMPAARAAATRRRRPATRRPSRSAARQTRGGRWHSASGAPSSERLSISSPRASAQCSA